MALSSIVKGLGQAISASGSILAEGNLNQIRQNSIDARWKTEQETSKNRFDDEMDFRKKQLQSQEEQSSKAVLSAENRHKDNVELNERQQTHKEKHDSEVLISSKAENLQSFIGKQVSALSDKREELQTSLQSGLISQDEAKVRYASLQRQEQSIVEQAVKGNPELLKQTIFANWLPELDDVSTPDTPANPLASNQNIPGSNSPLPGNNQIPSKDEMLNNTGTEMVKEKTYPVNPFQRPKTESKPVNPNRVALAVDTAELPEHLQPMGRKAKSTLKGRPSELKERNVFNELKLLDNDKYAKLMTLLQDPPEHVTREKISKYHPSLTKEQRQDRSLYLEFAKKKESVFKLARFFAPTVQQYAHN